MKNQIQAIYNSVAPKASANTQQKQTMTREQMLALLKKHGVNVANEATDEQLTAALEQLLNAKKNEPAKTDPAKAGNPFPLSGYSEVPVDQLSPG